MIALGIAYGAELMRNYAEVNDFFEISISRITKTKYIKNNSCLGKVGKKPELKKQEMWLKMNISRDQKKVRFHRVNSIFSSNMCTITGTLIVQYINRAQIKPNFEE